MTKSTGYLLFLGIILPNYLDRILIVECHKGFRHVAIKYLDISKTFKDFLCEAEVEKEEQAGTTYGGLKLLSDPF